MYNIFVNGPEKWVVKMQGSKFHVISEISQDWRISGDGDQAGRMGRMIAGGSQYWQPQKDSLRHGRDNLSFWHDNCTLSEW